MADLGHIEIRTTEYRPCYVVDVEYADDWKQCRIKERKKERKALFHRWAEKNHAIIKANKFTNYPQKVLDMVKRDYDERGILQPGFNVEVHPVTVAIVEYEDGTVGEVEPSAVRFVPGLINEYNFGEENE